MERAVTALKTNSWEASSLLLLQVNYEEHSFSCFHLVSLKAATAHCRCLVVAEFVKAFDKNEAISPSLHHLLSLLLQVGTFPSFRF